MVTYNFGSFTIDFDIDQEQVVINYPDGTRCIVKPNENDSFYGKRLGLFPLQYKLVHELAHQLVAFAYGHESCPIVYAEAHKQPFPENASWLEWQIIAVTDMAFGYNDVDTRALKELDKVKYSRLVARNLKKLFCKSNQWSGQNLINATGR